MFIESTDISLVFKTAEMVLDKYVKSFGKPNCQVITDNALDYVLIVRNKINFFSYYVYIYVIS